ncbi:hypothetical protein ACIQ1H_17010 [Lysinibacillus sp. NPDC097279]|uniref:hypothetical protein n=1 Tax=Lysinibacillus sp. NPDC097279 TaxID=3364143 RepID=UPI003823901E
MFERTIRPTDLATMLGVSLKNKRPKALADAMAEVVPGFGGLGRYKKYNRKEYEVISFIMRRIDEERATLEQAINDAVDLYYRNTVLIFG